MMTMILIMMMTTTDGKTRQRNLAGELSESRQADSWRRRREREIKFPFGALQLVGLGTKWNERPA